MKADCKLLNTSDADLEIAAGLLRAGELVSAPTETVYGLAANALDEAACRKVFEIKGRPLIDPLIVHFSSLEAAAPFVHLNESAVRLSESYWPGPLTLVLPKKPEIPDLVTAGLPSVAIRVPANPTFRRLLGLLDFPLAAPSANPFGYLSPTRAEHVVRTLGERIKAVIDDGPCHFGVESTIVDLRDPFRPSILRPGPIDAQSIGGMLGILLEDCTKAPEGGDGVAQSAPGMLTQHYSPNARIELIPHGAVDAAIRQGAAKSKPLVLNTKPADSEIPPDTYWLSESGALQECAHALFDLLYRLDRSGTETISVEMVDDTGIGRAINDRLRRAAAKRA